MRVLRFSLLLVAAVIFIGVPYANAAIQPVSDLIMYHDFEGNLSDGVGNHDGTSVNGAGFAADSPNATAGSQSSSYDGVDDRIEYGNPIDMNMNNGVPFSVAMWIKPATGGGGKAILGKSPPVPPGSLNGGGGTNTPSLIYNNGNLTYDIFWKGAFSSGGGTAPSGSWTHVVLTYDGATHKLYTDGAFKNQSGLVGTNEGANGRAPWVLSTGDSTNDSSPAQGPFPANLFDGNIDELAFWTSALSDAAVADVFRNGVEIPEPASLALLGLGGLLMIRRRR